MSENLCRQGPLDGSIILDTGTQFFMFVSYDDPDNLGQGHVYGRVGDEWHYQRDSSHQATEGLHEDD